MNASRAQERHILLNLRGSTCRKSESMRANRRMRPVQSCVRRQFCKHSTEKVTSAKQPWDWCILLHTYGCTPPISLAKNSLKLQWEANFCTNILGTIWFVINVRLVIWFCLARNTYFCLSNASIRLVIYILSRDLCCNPYSKTRGLGVEPWKCRSEVADQQISKSKESVTGKER
eukprot:2294004-Amphidinium_carterae.2